MIDLDTLNDLRAKLGKPALKGWKESKAKLAEAIAKLTTEHAAFLVAHMEDTFEASEAELAKQTTRPKSEDEQFAENAAALAERNTTPMRQQAEARAREAAADPTVSEKKKKTLQRLADVSPRKHVTPKPVVIPDRRLTPKEIQKLGKVDKKKYNKPLKNEDDPRRTSFTDWCRDENINARYARIRLRAASVPLGPEGRYELTDEVKRIARGKGVIPRS
jgi:hypothetical protein